MARRANPEFNAILAEHRAALNRLVDRRGVAQAKKVYDQAVAALEHKLARVAGPRSGSMTAHQARALSFQVRQGQAELAGRLAGELGAASRDAQVDSLHGLQRSVGRMSGRYRGAATALPIEEAAAFHGVVDKRKTSLMQYHKNSMDKYGAHSIKKMEDALFSHVVTGGSVGEAIDDVMDASDAEWYQAERIVRTEVAWAYNSAQVDGIEAAARQLPGLMMRWSEHVTDDGSFTKLDDRVGDDSVAMHGQVASPGEPFTMPSSTPGGKSTGTLAGGQWNFPPNRPNDRAVVTPWQTDWGVMGWAWRGSRVYLVRP